MAATGHASAMGRRCSECRKSFEAAPSADEMQQVCGVVCRARRDRKLARARRCADLDDARTGERRRQRLNRVRKAAASGCHAVPSQRKPMESWEEVMRSVDRALALSRGSLVRDLGEMIWQLEENLASPGGCHAGASDHKLMI
jgi:hypothetical protein